MPFTSAGEVVLDVVDGIVTGMPPLKICVVTSVVTVYCAFLPGADEHVVSVKLLAARALSGTHEPTAVGPTIVGVQVVVTQLFPALAVAPTQVPGTTSVGPVLTVVQVVLVQELPTFAVSLAQGVATPVTLLVVLQTVSVQLLAAVLVSDVQEATGAGDVLLSEQVVSTQLLPAEGAW